MNEIKRSNHAQDFFLYLLMFLSLNFLSFGSGSILFQAVGKFLPDPIASTFDQGGVRFGIAAIFIAGPIFFIIARIITRRLSEGVISLESGVRKWLTYIVLFFAAATVIGDLITLVLNFLGGETTVQFLLKALVVLAIAGGIFSYYFWDMRKTEVDEKVSKLSRTSALIVMGYLAIVFVGAFFIIDSPSVARQKRIDSQTASDAQSVDSSIRNYFTQAGKLPETLVDLEKTGFTPYLQSANKIEYIPTGENAYKLCASFERADVDDKDVFFGMQGSVEWKHQAGKVCFERIALDENEKNLPTK
jgi:hypothetical protein